MAARFPTQLPNLPTLTTVSQQGTTFANVDLSNRRERQWMADVSAELLAIATALGVTGTADSTAILYKVANKTWLTNDVPSTYAYNGSTYVPTTSRQVFNILNQSDPDPT